ncbi:CRISPR-associated endonuclease Cas1 [Synechococcus sp. PCC 6312]|uniref:CRISPR-associated endonuclease Cas1 n=1 Tax=Synechococcus sp. (strain ATCC 27167 / PCC 6312) TaxID=195253 RepID=UPI00029EFEC5|nr:CRISPR-associated endonuclease Cas1 [Synechococcus sp. PCC 6312]AFY61926.1 CRISPR-associated endonuclease Cas1 [Synechococcus sp. PCC 6312]
MKSLYVSQQGCYLCLSQEQILIKKGKTTLNQVQLPLVEQILIFGKSQVTTQLIRACLAQEIPILYLSRMGYCYGRVLPIQRGYRQLSRYQQLLTPVDRLLAAQAIVTAKLKNSRVFLMRHHRSHPSTNLEMAIQQLGYLITKVPQTDTIERLLGTEGAGAAIYFATFGNCIQNPNFIFIARTRRPPGNPINAMLSFGYQVLWNHLLSLIELNDLDPYQACLHQASERHAALASDLIEEFRTAIVDSLVIYMINRNMIDADQDFEFINGGCYINDSGRKKYLQAFLNRMEEAIGPDHQLRWDSLMQQVKRFREFAYAPSRKYQPYLIR